MFLKCFLLKTNVIFSFEHGFEKCCWKKCVLKMSLKRFLVCKCVLFSFRPLHAKSFFSLKNTFLNNCLKTCVEKCFCMFLNLCLKTVLKHGWKQKMNLEHVLNLCLKNMIEKMIWSLFGEGEIVSLHHVSKHVLKTGEKKCFTMFLKRVLSEGRCFKTFVLDFCLKMVFKNIVNIVFLTNVLKKLFETFSKPWFQNIFQKPVFHNNCFKTFVQKNEKNRAHMPHTFFAKQCLKQNSSKHVPTHFQNVFSLSTT